MPRAKQRTPELAELVLATALRIIGREGVDALTARHLAHQAGTSASAVYELFGDKTGVVRAMFFSGFAQLGEHLEASGPRSDPTDNLLALAARYRRFIVAHPALSAVMFSRPFASFDPVPEEAAAGARVRELIVAAVRRSTDARRLHGDPVDIAHAFVALVHGLAAAESAGRLGGSPHAVERRWDLAVRALLAGFGTDDGGPAPAGCPGSRAPGRAGRGSGHYETMFEPSGT